MTVFPILSRELRVRARSRSNYWSRFAVVLVGLLICLPQLLSSSPFSNSPATIGRGVFTGLVSAAFLLCCSACLITADAISAERREGTLGLLLLTHVRNFDVLLGKFASSGLACFFALIAFLPLLMLPVLAGGVTGGEAFRKSLALLDTLFLALTAGLWASARGSDKAASARRGILLLLALILLPPLMGLLPAFIDLLRTTVRSLSPLTSLSQAADANYTSSPARFWYSLGLIQLIGWVLLLNAGAAMRQLHADPPAPSERRSLSRSAAASPRTAHQIPCSESFVPAAAGTAALQPLEAPPIIADSSHAWPRPIPWRPPPILLGPLTLGRSPIDWLMDRQRGLKPVVWIAALIGFFHVLLSQVVFFVAGRFLGAPNSFLGLYAGFSSGLGLVLIAITGSAFAWAASRFFIESRRNGELEVLLTTPLGAHEIVSAQWDYLKRLLRAPLVLILVPMCLQGLFMLVLPRFPAQGAFQIHYAGSTLLSLLNAVVGLGALCWVGLWFGFRAQSQVRAILWTVGLTRLLPYVVLMIFPLLLHLIGTPALSPGRTYWTFVWLLPQLLNLCFSLWLVRFARRRLLLELSVK